MKKRGGFTLVELVVVIVAISVLAGLAVIGITRYQADTRDAQRSANVSTISNALETYFTQNGNYPSCAAITADANILTTATLKGLDKKALTVPGSDSTESNVIRCGDTLALVGDDFIEYQGDGSSSCSGSGSCSSYKLIYRSELNSTLKEVQSHGLFSGQVPPTQTVPTTPTAENTISLGAPTLNATVNSPTKVTLNWTAARNATDLTTYTLTRATNSTFTTGVVTTKGLKSTSDVTDNLASGRTYFFKVQAVSPVNTSEFSNIASNIVIPVTPTEVTATANSPTQVTVAWAASANATGYVVKYGVTDGATTYSATTKNTSLAISNNLTQGTEWFFKVYATASGVESAGSATVKQTTPISAPAVFEITSANDSMSITGVASAANCPAGTTKYYAWKANNTAWVNGTNYVRATYALSYGQDVTLKAAVKCQKGSIASAYTQSSNSVTYTRAGMNLTLTAGDDGCKAEYCGRTINANWTNICGTKTANIKAKQLSSLANWKTTGPSSDSIKWKGASGSGVRVSYYEVNIGCASSAASINVMSAYKCTGCN
jgi:prepilin-type N-terminal cleavage/methylation domain-containing protein